MRLKYLFLSLTALSMAALPSCQSAEEIPVPELSGNDGQTITLSVNLPQPEMRTRADGFDISNVKCYIYFHSEEYNESPVMVKDIAITETDGTYKGVLTMKIPKDESYDLVFLASSYPQEDSDAKVWYNSTERSLNVDYSKFDANDDSVDCFFAALSNITVANVPDVPVGLKRPFALMRIGTCDLEDYNSLSKSPLKSAGFTVSAAYQKMDMMNGELTGEPVSVTFPSAELAEDATFPISKNKFLSKGFMLVKDRMKVNLTMNTTKADDSNFNPEYDGIPVERNHQTVVYGNLLTSPKDINVDVDPFFRPTINADVKDYPEYDLVLQLADDPYGDFTLGYYFDENFNYIDLSEHADANNIVSLTWNQLGITNDAWAKISFENLSITKVLKCDLNKLKIATMENMFNGCSKLSYIDLKNFKTTDVTDMSYMFNNCNSLTNIDLSSFNTTNVENMRNMFGACSSLTEIDLSNFDTTNVNNMLGMFVGCSNLESLDLSNFDTKKVHYMGSMFHNCSKLTNINLSNFDTANVNFMDHMFSDCTSLTNIDLSNFITTNLANMTGMFSGCTSLTNIDVSNFDTSNVYFMDDMFEGCTSLTHLDLSNFTFKEGVNTTNMFKDCPAEINWGDNTPIN